MFGASVFWRGLIPEGHLRIRPLGSKAFSAAASGRGSSLRSLAAAAPFAHPGRQKDKTK